MVIISKLKACLAILFLTTPALIVYFSYMLDIRGDSYRKYSDSVLNRPYQRFEEFDDDDDTDFEEYEGLVEKDPFEYAQLERRFQETTTEAPNLSTRPHSQRRYLLPVLKIWGGGNNVEFQSFKTVVMLAMYLNRTVVLTPFYDHGGHSREGYSAETLRHFKDTFDIEKLSRIVPVATVEEYLEDCPVIEHMLFWNTTYWRYTTDLHRENLGIEIPRLEDLAKTGQHSWRQLVKYNQELRCVGFYDPHRFRADVPQYQAYQKIIDEHLVRSTWVKQMTDVARADICEGRPYLALHFRNKTGEGCHFFLDVRGSECEALIPTISYVADIVTVIVVDYMQKFRLDCLYVAHPLWSYEIVDHLAAKIPRRNIYTSADISAEKHPELELFKEDMYFLSLLEQEICARSSAFIGCGRSNWSIFVWKERLAAGRVASYLLKQMPGIPKELQAHL